MDGQLGISVAVDVPRIVLAVEGDPLLRDIVLKAYDAGWSDYHESSKQPQGGTYREDSDIVALVLRRLRERWNSSAAGQEVPSLVVQPERWERS